MSMNSNIMQNQLENAAKYEIISKNIVAVPFQKVQICPIKY